MTVSNVRKHLARTEHSLTSAETTISKANQLVHLAVALDELTRAFHILNDTIRDLAQSEEVSK